MNKEFTYNIYVMWNVPIFEYCNFCDVCNTHFRLTNKYCPSCYYVDINDNKIYKYHNPVFDNMINKDDESKPEKCFVCKKKECIPESSFCSKKCKMINYNHQVKFGEGCQHIYCETRKCHRQLYSKYGCCRNHHISYLLQQSNRKYGCVRFECPCPTTMNGEFGEFCCEECKYKKCEKPYHYQ